MTGRARTVAVRVVVLAVVWVALWGEVTVANVVGGLAVGAVVTALVPPQEGARRLAPVATLRFAATFVKLLVVASVEVAVDVVRPRPRRAEAVLVVPLSTRSQPLAAVVANTISLTPGTLTLDVVDRDDGLALQVHTLGLDRPDEVRATVRRTEELVLAAFPPRRPS